MKEADPDLVADLDARGLLLRAEIHRHQYPHCWRCGTPLLYYAKPSWYIRTTAVVDRMLELNRGIGWHPERVRDGRFGQVARGQRQLGDLARPLLGHARCRCGAAPTATAWTPSAPTPSCARARPRSCRSRFDPHRPYVDDDRPDVRLRRRDARGSPRSSTSGTTAARCRSPRSTTRSRREVTSRGGSRPTSSARRSTRRAGGSTRCWPRARCSSTRPPTATSSASG